MSARKRGQASFTQCECGDHCFAPLTLGYVTMVSPEDSHHLESWWQAKVRDGIAYACKRLGGKGQRRNYYLHRDILNVPDELFGDHRNGDTLDNRRPNLRVASCSENNANRRMKRRALPRGVYLRQDGAYMAMIRKDGVQRHLGRFSDPDIAHAAYVKAAAELHGEFARFD